MAGSIGLRDSGLVGSDGTYDLTITPPVGLSAHDTISFADLFASGGGGVSTIIAGTGISVSGTTNVTVTNDGVRTLATGYGATETGTNDKTVTVALTSATATLGSAVSMVNANTFYDGPQVTLAAGTWLVVGTITCTRAATNATQYTGRIGDGTTNYAATQASHPSQNPHAVSLSMSAVITLGTTTDIKLQAAANQTNAVMQNTPTINGAGSTNLATRINAIRIS